jgi:hypothetical protein
LLLTSPSPFARSRFQDGVAESTEQLTQLDLEYAAAQGRVTSLNQELGASTEQLQATQVRVHDVESLLEQAKA